MNDGWNNWLNIFAWRSDSGLYINTSVFYIPIEYAMPIIFRRSDSCLLSALSQNSFDVVFSSGSLLVFLQGDWYMSIADCILWHEGQWEKAYYSVPEDYDNYRAWYNHCALELHRISRHFSSGIPSGTSPEVVFSDTFYSQYYAFLESFDGLHDELLSGLTNLRPDLFPVEVKEQPKNTGEKDVYFIQGQDTKRIKIGISDDVQRRLKAIQASEPLKLLGVIKEGGKALEAELHKRFAHIRIYNEWFQSNTELLEYIRTHAIT